MSEENREPAVGREAVKKAIVEKLATRSCGSRGRHPPKVKPTEKTESGTTKVILWI